MFSWKNIKTTIRQKVVNGETGSDKALGVAEVLGKTVVSGTTSVVKAMPSIVSSMLDDVIKNQPDAQKKIEAINAQNKCNEWANSIEQNSLSSSEKESKELEKYENDLKNIQEKMKKNNEKTDYLEKKLMDLYEKIEKAPELEKDDLQSQKEKLLKEYDSKINQIPKLFKKERQLQAIIDDYKMDD